MPNEKNPSGFYLATEAEGADRWIAGKSEEELLSDLKVYLARLRDDPHSIPDRLRVAAIQLRLGRFEEALIHYEGVVRGYVSTGQINSAIALCERILGIYPNLGKLQKLLAALYARAPQRNEDSAIFPLHSEEDSETGFIVSGSQAIQSGRRNNLEDDLVVDSIYEAPHKRTSAADLHEFLDDEELKPTMHFASSKEDDPVPLTRPKTNHRHEIDSENKVRDDASTEVMLLTKPKKKKR